MDAGAGSVLDAILDAPDAAVLVTLCFANLCLHMLNMCALAHGAPRWFVWGSMAQVALYAMLGVLLFVCFFATCSVDPTVHVIAVVVNLGIFAVARTAFGRDGLKME